MCPVFSTADEGRHARRTADPARYLATSKSFAMESANLKNLRLCQFGKTMASPLCASALCFLVAVVVSLCAKEQVFGIDARRVVAPMQDVHAFRDRSIMQLPRHTMSSQTRLAVWHMDAAVAERSLTSRPQPAPIRLADLAPESVSDWFARPSLAPHVAKLGSVGRKWSAAKLTGAENDRIALHRNPPGYGAMGPDTPMSRSQLYCSTLTEVASFTIWSYHKAPFNPVSGSHTWATFVYKGETICVSWGPEGDGTDALRKPTAGKLYSHEATLEWAKNKKLKVKEYGPHSCSPELFHKAKAWRDHLASGAVRYVLVDVDKRPGAVNCVSSVLYCCGKRIVTGFQHGPDASRHIARYFQRHFGE